MGGQPLFGYGNSEKTLLSRTAQLAPMDEGIRDAKTGRIVPADEVRRLVPQWTTASSCTQQALNDLAEIIGHIADDDAEAASRFAESLLDRLDLRVRFRAGERTIRKGARVSQAVA